MVARRTVAHLLIAAGLWGAGCDEQAPQPPGEASLRVLAGVADDVVRPAVERFAARASELAVAEGDALPDAWIAAADAWQELEVLQIGPAGAAGSVVGGQDLRDELWSWPRLNLCRIDQETEEQGYANEGFFEQEHVNVYGLDAMDYLLFAPDDYTDCPPLIPMMQEGRWAALGDAEVRARRRAYASAAAGEVDRRAQEIAGAWDPDDGDWGTALKSPGDERSPYADAQTALNDVFAALFYMDLVAKDLKLAKPAGLLGCSDPACPKAVESRWAGRSVDHLLANIRAAQAVVGAFEPLLADRGASSIGDDLQTELSAAADALRGLPGDLAVVVADDPAPAQACHAALKRFTDVLKGPFVTVLSLTIPDEGAGDND